MHNIFRKLFGSKKSALARWLAFREDVETKLAGLQSAFVAAAEHDRIVASAREAFIAAPNVESLAPWRAAAAERQAAREIASQVIAHLQDQRKTSLLAGRPLLLELIAEGEAEVKKQVQQIQEEDARRTEEVGEAFVSGGPLESLAEKLELFRRARAMVPNDVTGAAGLVSSAIEAET